jgi:anti-sigma factor RsiW
MDDRHLGEGPEDLQCVEFVELISSYLEDALPADLRARIDAHLDICPGCPNAIAQLRTVIDLTGELTESDVEDLDPLQREALLSTFRRLRRR